MILVTGATGKIARVTDTVERVTGQPPRGFGEFARDLAAGHLRMHDLAP